MSSSQDLPLETFNTTEMSSKADANESTAPQLTPGAIQIDPSTLIQTSKNQKKAQPQTSNSKANKNKKTKNPRTESDHNDESSEDEEDKLGVTEKKNPHRENDDNGNGKSLMYLLLDWLTKEGNYDRYKKNRCEKRGVAEEIQQYMINNGIHSRDASTIGKKITCLEKAWRDAKTIRCRTGEGSLTTARDCKAIKGWANDNPKWLSLEKAALPPILKKCRYYFKLERFLETQHGNTRLAPAQSFANDDADEVEILTQSQCVAREHSVHSNSAYENINNKIKELDWDPIEHSPNSNLGYNDRIGSFDETMDEIKRAIENADNDVQNSNDNMKRTSSKSSLALSSRGSSTKRGSSQKSGSASSIHDLIKKNPLDNQINIINGPISQLHSHELGCLSQIVDNVASHMFPQHKKSFLSEDDAKKKAKIKLDMAAVQLKSEKKKLQQHNFDLLLRREKHNLEMQWYQAEITDEQMTRHAQLISMLMKENNLSLQDATNAAQSVQAMVQSTSTLQSSLTKQPLISEELSTDELSSSADE
ncbi:hypothetical protein DFH28DRAFT_1140619 [Melampsora americana]|nr:hypothetical protein DFH28DRAFT_1140619 [Melampsora americana]